MGGRPALFRSSLVLALSVAVAGGSVVARGQSNDPRSAGTPALTDLGTAAPDRAVEASAIRHKARSCAVRGSFARIEAEIELAVLVDSPVVQFRTEKAAGWYSTIMLPSSGDSYVAYLPKPRSAKQFEYFIQIGNAEEPDVRTDEVRVRVFEKPEQCPEASTDPAEAGSVLLITAPPEASEDDPVPPGFSIRGTIADAGVLEMRSKKAFVAGLLGLGAAAAGATALASGGPVEYEGPKPFVEAPGVAFVASTPAPGSTLSLSSGSLAVELRIFSPRTMAGARITLFLAAGNYLGHCIALSGVHDLEGGRTESVVISGPTRRDGPSCVVQVPLEELRVGVVESTGLGGFFTGVPGLPHLRVNYRIEE